MTTAEDRWSRLLTALAAREGTNLTLGGICAACADVLLVSGATIALMSDSGVPAVTYRSDPSFEPLESLQFTTGLGPALEAYVDGVAVVEPDLLLRPPQRWTGFADRAAEVGVRAVFSFPLHIGAARFGALTLYQGHPGPLGDDRRSDALVMAGIATRAVLAMQAGAADEMLAAEITNGHFDHAEVHQASGMLSVQLDIGVGDALARIRARAFTDGTSARHVAAEILSGRLRFDT